MATTETHMAIKQGYPLNNIKELPPESIQRCLALSISTVEELLSHYAQESEKLSRGLEMDLSEVKSLVDTASKYISAEARDKIFQSSLKRRSLGAKNPHSSKFEEYIIKHCRE